MRIHWLLGLALLAVAPTGVAEICLPDVIAPTTPDSRYDTTPPPDPDSGRAYVIDRQTGLEWMRCALGQSYDAGTNRCIGDPSRYDWAGALQVAQDYPGWRLPTIKELQSLVDMQCYGPAINSRIFPDTPGSPAPEYFGGTPTPPPVGFWSSTPFHELDGRGEYSQAWILQPFLGDATPAPKTNPVNYVRLVRDPNP